MSLNRALRGTVRVLGAPFSWGQPRAGTERAPAALRAAGLAGVIEKAGWRCTDLGDVALAAPAAPAAPAAGAGARIPPRGATAAAAAAPPSLRNALEVGHGCRAIADAVSGAAAVGAADDFVLTLGGDHSIAMGSISGLLRARARTGPADLAVLWVDAHADINDPSTSPSGNIHGMPLSFLLRLFDPTPLAGYEWLAGCPPLRKERLCYVGLRDLDDGEKVFIKALGVRAFTMQDIDRHGIGKVMEMALEHVNRGAGAGLPLHLSFDIDAVDPAVAPSTGTAVPGGLSFREAHYVCEAAAETGALRSMDLVEVNPLLSPRRAKQTVDFALALVASALGRTILPH